MIKSFKHKGLQRSFETGSLAGIQPYHASRLRMQLAALDTAQTVDDMNLPGFRLHALQGQRKDVWSTTVSGMQDNYDLWQARQSVNLERVQKVEFAEV